MQNNKFNSLSFDGVNVTHTPIQCHFSPKVWINLPKVYKTKVNTLINALENGVPFPKLGGKKIKCNDVFVRFRIGRSYRLLLKNNSSKRELVLLKRESYENFFKRRR